MPSPDLCNGPSSCLGVARLGFAARVCSGERVLGIELIWNPSHLPGQGLDLELSLDEAAAGYAAMDERRAIKALLTT